MSDIVYLTVLDVIDLHQWVMENTGVFPASLRDQGLLESALMRPQMAAHYEQADLIKQSAILAIAISQAQAFVDGNKRTAFAAFDAFLRLNGFKYGGDSISFAQQLEMIADKSQDIVNTIESLDGWLQDQVSRL
jgi:death-on-curing protein